MGRARTKSPLERAARALCSHAGNPENATMDGKPLWQSYLPEARAALDGGFAALRERILAFQSGVDLMADHGSEGASGAASALDDVLSMFDDALADEADG